MNNKLTISDIAAALNISKATVSLVLNGKAKQAKISKKMEDKVLQYMEEVGYRPNLFAQGLRTGKTKIIGMLVEDISDPFFSAIARHAEEVAYEKGYKIVYCSTENNTKKTKEMLHMYRGQKIDGYIIAPPPGIEKEVKERLSGIYTVDTENRIQAEIKNEELWKGYKMIAGALCGLLALIGIANIFSHTLGFLYQRKREFARYLSVGVTPAGIKKMLWIEALTVAGRPLLITVPLAALFAVFAVTASYLDPAEFLVALPVFPVLLFILLIFVFVGLAYYIGGKRLLQWDLSEVLGNDTMI